MRYDIHIDTKEGIDIREDDLILAKIYNPLGIMEVRADIIAINNNVAIIETDSILSDNDILSFKDATWVRIGNKTDISRQSYIDLCGVGEHGGYIAMFSGIDSWDKYGDFNCLSMYAGDYSRIKNHDIPDLNGSGLMIDNGVFRGQIYAIGGNVPTKDDIAQNLGYDNYEDIKNKAEQGKTLILNGLIRSSLLDIDNMLVDKEGIIKWKAIIDKDEVSKSVLGEILTEIGDDYVLTQNIICRTIKSIDNAYAIDKDGNAYVRSLRIKGNLQQDFQELVLNSSITLNYDHCYYLIKQQNRQGRINLPINPEEGKIIGIMTINLSGDDYMYTEIDAGTSHPISEDIRTGREDNLLHYFSSIKTNCFTRFIYNRGCWHCMDEIERSKMKYLYGYSSSSAYIVATGVEEIFFQTHNMNSEPYIFFEKPYKIGQKRLIHNIGGDTSTRWVKLKTDNIDSWHRPTHIEPHQSWEFISAPVYNSNGTMTLKWIAKRRE